MTLSELLKALPTDNDLESAQVLANILNVDRLTVQAIAGRTQYQPSDIVRLGRLLHLYDDLKPAAAAQS
jgi:hypothetical protein